MVLEMAGSGRSWRRRGKEREVGGNGEAKCFAGINELDGLVMEFLKSCSLWENALELSGATHHYMHIVFKKIPRNKKK